MDAGRFWLRLASRDFTVKLDEGAVESSESSDAADLSHRVTGSRQDSPVESPRVDGRLSRLSSFRKPDGMGVQGGAEWDVDGRTDIRNAEDVTTPMEKQLRTGGDIPPRGRTVVQVRFPKRCYNT